VVAVARAAVSARLPHVSAVVPVLPRLPHVSAPVLARLLQVSVSLSLAWPRQCDA